MFRLTGSIPGSHSPMAEQQDSNVLEFAAPLNTSEEHVALYFSDITKKHVDCEKESCIIRVFFSKEEAFQQIVNTREQKIGTEYKLTRLMIDSGSVLPTPARQGRIADSSPFVLLSLRVDSRVHITKHCLEELRSLPKDRRYFLHRTAVPGELVMEWRGPASERDDQLVIRQISEYANTFLTITIEYSEQLADEKLREVVLWESSADLSCTKIGQSGKDQLYIISGKKDIMSRMHNWLPNLKPVHHLLLVPDTTVVVESKAIPECLFACDASSVAINEDPASIEVKKGITVLSTKDVQSGAMRDAVVTNNARSSVTTSTVSRKHPASDLTTVKSELAGSCTASNPATCKCNSSGHSKARHQRNDSPSEEPSSSDVAATHFSSVACTTSISEDTSTPVGVHRKSSALSSTNQQQHDANPDSLVPRQREIDQQKAQQHIQRQSLPSRETVRYEPRSSLRIHMDPTQLEHELLRTQGNEQSHQQSKKHYESMHTLTEAEKQWLEEQEWNRTPQGRVHPWPNCSAPTSRAQENVPSNHQCSKFSEEDYESVRTLTEAEKQWLKEQERNRTPRGCVRLWPSSSASTSTTGKQLEHEQDYNEIKLRLEFQKSVRAKTGDVILEDKANSAANNGSVVQVQQQKKIQDERQSAAQTPALSWSLKDSQEQAAPPEHVGHSYPQPITQLPGLEYGDGGARRNVSSHNDTRHKSFKESDV